MGQFDSSRTRVAPVFDHLLRSDPSGISWLPRLLKLGTRANQACLPKQIGELLPNHPAWWGQNERPLLPPLRLLEWLLRNISLNDVLANGKTSVATLAKRQALANGDHKILGDALRKLRSGERGSKWFVLEGISYPDVFIETENIVLVIEGKRTERTTTSKTTWMPKRSQLVRHMDSAIEIANGRQVLGLLVVEGNTNSPMSVPPKWLKASAEQLKPELFVPSLPHRTEKQRQAISDGLLGAVTWQKICEEFAIDWPPVKDF